MDSQIDSRDIVQSRPWLVFILVAAMVIPLAAVDAYPTVLMEITRRAFTNVQAPMDSFAPMNYLVHVRQFPDYTKDEVMRANADTLYSLAW